MCALVGLDVAIRLRQRVDERRKHRRKQLAVLCPRTLHGRRDHRADETLLVEAWPFDGVADLLLVQPALGVLARDVEPDRRRLRPSPAHRAAHRSQIERREVAMQVVAGHAQHLEQQRRADPPRRGHPLFVPGVQERDQLLPAIDLLRNAVVIVALSREHTDVVTQDVETDVFDGPACADRLVPPLLVAQRRK